jgi:hypothetical protein
MLIRQPRTAVTVLSLLPFPVEFALMAVLVVEVLCLQDILRFAAGDVIAPLNTLTTNTPKHFH